MRPRSICVSISWFWTSWARNNQHPSLKCAPLGALEEEESAGRLLFFVPLPVQNREQFHRFVTISSQAGHNLLISLSLSEGMTEPAGRQLFQKLTLPHGGSPKGEPLFVFKVSSSMSIISVFWIYPSGTQILNIHFTGELKVLPLLVNKTTPFWRQIDTRMVQL